MRSTPNIIIKPQANRSLFDWNEFRQYKDLLIFFILRDIKVIYAQSILGIGWAFIKPFFSMIVFSIIFGGLAKVSSDGIPYPIFSYAGLLPWYYFSTALTSAAGSLSNNASIFSKVYFPRIWMPLTPVVASFLDFAIASLFLGALMLWYDISPSMNIIWMPLLILIMMTSAFGTGIGLASLAIQYRDVRYGLQFLMQMMMYAAPVVWPASLILEKCPDYGMYIRWAYGLYPMVGVIEGMRASLLNTSPMPWDLITIGAISSLITMILGVKYFKAREHIFADVV